MTRGEWSFAFIGGGLALLAVAQYMKVCRKKYLDETRLFCGTPDQVMEHMRQWQAQNPGERGFITQNDKIVARIDENGVVKNA